jgi:hypothetical protein
VHRYEWCQLEPGQYASAPANRNFEGRQGKVDEPSLAHLLLLQHVLSKEKFLMSELFFVLSPYSSQATKQR